MGLDRVKTVDEGTDLTAVVIDKDIPPPPRPILKHLDKPPEKMPAPPKQRKIAIVGSRSVGSYTLASDIQHRTLRMETRARYIELQTDDKDRQEFPDSPIRRRPLRRILLPHDREHIQQSNTAQEPGLCDGDHRHGRPGTYTCIHKHTSIPSSPFSPLI